MRQSWTGEEIVDTAEKRRRRGEFYTYAVLFELVITVLVYYVLVDLGLS